VRGLASLGELRGCRQTQGACILNFSPSERGRAINKGEERVCGSAMQEAPSFLEICELFIMLKGTRAQIDT